MTNEKRKEVMKKEYFNQEAYDYIAIQLNKTQINPLFRPIVIDIILRRRHEYQLDDKYFHRDVESFVRNVEDIYWEDLLEKKGGDFWPEKKCIRINRNAFKDDMNDEQFAEKLLKIIGHECGHAMNFDETGNDRTFKTDPTDPADETIPIDGILEIFTEKENDRLISNRKQEDAFKYYNETLGYSSTTKYVNTIAAVFGIKEKDLLSAAIKGEEDLYEVLNVNIKDKNFSKDKFKEISFNTRIAHKELYKDKDEEIDLKNLGCALRKIYENSEQILAYRINNLEWDNLEELQEKLEDIKLSQNAISNIMPLEKGQDDETIEKLARLGKRMVYAKVMCMEEIIKGKGEKSRELISFVQRSESVDEILEFMKQNGIEIDSENLALMPEFELSQQKKDEWVKEFSLDGEEWDNTEQIKYIMANKEKIMKVKEKVSFVDIINKIEGVYSKVLAPFSFPFKLLGKAGKKLWKALPKKEKPLLLGERRRRKNRRQEAVGFI